MDLPRVDMDSSLDSVGPIGPTRLGWSSTSPSSMGQEPAACVSRSNGGSRETGWGSGTLELRGREKTKAENRNRMRWNFGRDGGRMQRRNADSE